MPTLAVIPSLPVHMTGSRSALLTRKFVEGMNRYASLWDGPVVAVMSPHSSTSTGNLDDAVYDLDDLAFEVKCAAVASDEFYTALEDADAVMFGGDDRLAELTDWCRTRGKKSVYVSEYTLRTRIQIIKAEVSNPLKRLRKYLWEWRQEQRNRRSVRSADAVQCNGTPTFDSYRQLNPNSLLFLDSRTTASMLATADTLAARQRQLSTNSHIRLAYSGRLTRIKGADHLIEVARHLQLNGIGFTLDIFGDGDLRSAMETRVAELGLDAIVRIHGAVDYAEELAPFVCDNVDLFVCCHRQGDPSCTYLETLACGVPVVGYANEALDGIVSKAPVGWTTPLNRPELLAGRIAELCENKELLAEFAQAALAFAREHTFEKEFAARIAQIQKLFLRGSVSRKELPLHELARERVQGYINRKRADKLRARASNSAFPSDARQRLLLISQRERIPQSQIFPFHYYSETLRSRYAAAVREAPIETALQDQLPADATVVAIQPDYDTPDADLMRLLEKIRETSPAARIAYLDWSAPADLRNAERLNQHIDIYVKKHVLRDRNLYGTPTLGDTNLADYYSRRHDIVDQEYCFPIPAGFMDKLLVGPSFSTAPMLLPQLMRPFASGRERSIDLHARFAVGGTPWYQAMRSEAEAALTKCSDLTLASEGMMPLYQFITELKHSKVCFSPFGYGEVCWRDYEAVMAGAVLLKPDMSHIETDPDIFRPWETYVPVRWDLSDFDTTLRKVLADTALQKKIARNAHSVLHDYLHSARFAEQMQPLFHE